jgi:hypothetical protein
MEQTKDFLEVPFRGPDPFIAEIFDFHDGNGGFARQALHEACIYIVDTVWLSAVTFATAFKMPGLS